MGVIVKLRRVISAAAILVAIPVAGAPASASVSVPSGEMGFEVEIDIPTETPQPDCTPSLTDIGLQLMTGGSADVTCKIGINANDQRSTGTVSNAELAESDPGFESGTLAQTCDVKQNVETAMTVSRSSTTMKSFKGQVWQACTWRMAFPDAKKSTMSGTIEVNGSLGSDDGSVEDDAVEIAFTAKVFVVSGTGVFAGYTGTGEITRQDSIDLGMMQGGGDDGDDQPTPSGGTEAAMQQFCATNNISPCTSSGLAQFCQANPTKCAAPGASAQRVSASAVKFAARSVRSMSTQSTMSLSLKKGAGAVRILSPAPPAGQPKAAASVTNSTRIEIVATPGATCQIKTNKGKVVVSKKVTSAASTVLKPKSGSMKGATSLRAFCAVGKKSISSNVVKVKVK